MRRAFVLLGLLAALTAPAPALALAARASLVDVEDEVMCVSCKIPLNIADSAQAGRERAFIQRLIDQGRDKDQIKAALVTEYGRNVLALPDKGGFGITAYLVPIALVAALLGAMALVLPRWRRRAPAGIGPGGAALSLPDAARLDEDLARYDR